METSTFTAEQQQRLIELMALWRVARDSGVSFPSSDQQELESLVDAELLDTARRAREMACSQS